MRRALVLAAVTALALARPEMYKEKEDFQYSRSSSDEGSKSGFYGAQRGNMGGNYERAHNMDSLAQHQMGGLVRTVEGELGDGAKQKSGSVFSAANSRGVYGAGHYDLSNLEGRNFQEGTTFGDSQSHSSLSSQQAGYGSQSYRHSSAANSAYGSQSQSSRYHQYQTASSADQALYANNMQSADNLQSASENDGTHLSSHGNGYYSQSGYQGQNLYDQAAASQHSSNAYGLTNTRGSHYRLVGVSPVRVYVRPGSTVTIPVAAQSYDASQGSASTLDQNSINSEVEALSHDHSGLKPTGDAKHYESSYSYRKEWEKHDTVPVTALPLAVPTINPYPSNSELYEDNQAQGSEHQHEASAQEARNVHSSNQYRGYNVKSGSSRHHAASSTYGHSASDLHQAATSTHGHSASDAASVASSSANTHGAYNYGASNLNSANLNSQVEDFGSKPKSYQSSYSYHKSWERQGDPYVIQPSTNGLYTSADSLASQKLTSSSLNQGTSYGSHQYGSRYHQGHGYSSDCDCDENGHIRVARSYNLHHEQPSYQQSQNEGQDYYFGQQSQNLEDLGQQSQNLEDFGQQSQNLQDFGQLPQHLEDFGQQSQKLEDLGQQSQNLEDLGQQSQNLEDLGQQSQKLEDLGQQSQNLEDFGQQSQNLHSFGQETQNLEDFGQQTQELGQQTQNHWDQQSQTDAGQETQKTWNMFQPIPDSNQDTAQQPGSISEIRHPSQYRPFQPDDQMKPNPFGQTNERDHVQQITNSGKDKDIMQSQDISPQTGQQTQYNWQSYQTNMNQNGQNAYVPVLPFNMERPYQELPDWQKYLENHHHNIDTGYGQNQYHHHHHQMGFDSNSWIFNQQSLNPGNGNTRYETNSWVINPAYSHPNLDNNAYGNPYTNTQYYPLPESPNTYTQTYSYITRNNHTTYSTSNHNSDSTSLSNLWNFLDNTEKQTLPETETGFNSGDWNHKKQENEQEHTNFDLTQQDHENSFNTNKVNLNKEDQQSNTMFDLTQNYNKTSFGTNDREHAIESTTATMVTTTVKKDNLRPHDVERGDIAPEKLKPQEEPGRGDIGPENSSEEDVALLNKPYVNTQIKPLEILGTVTTEHTPYKTPEEIETLSLTKDKTAPANANTIEEEKNVYPENNDKESETELRVISLNEEHSELQRDISRTTSTTPRINYGYVHPHFIVEQENQHDNEQVENVDQQRYNQFESINQQNVDQQSSDFGQQLGDFRQQLADFGQQTEHKEQELESFDQQNENLEQQNVNKKWTDLDGPKHIEQQNEDHGFEILGQQSEGLNQESFNQFEDLGQQSEDFGHQLTDSFGQHNEGFQQESLGDFGQHEQIQQESVPSFNQQSENFNVAPREQQLETLGQETENLEQQRQTSDLWKPDEQQQTTQVEVFAPPSPLNKEGRTFFDREAVMEPEIVTKKYTNEDTPPEPVTEKTGFWNKVGSKFSSAKDKVKSWFSSS